MQIKVNESECTGCAICAEVCPFGAIAIDAIAHVDQDDCRCCGACVSECPVQALSIEDIPRPAPTSSIPTSYSGTSEGRGYGHHRGRQRKRGRDRPGAWWK